MLKAVVAEGVKDRRPQVLDRRVGLRLGQVGHRHQHDDGVLGRIEVDFVGRQPGAGLVGMRQDVVEGQEEVALASAVTAADDKVALAVDVPVAERGLQPVEQSLERGGGESGAENALGAAFERFGVIVEEGVEGDDTVQIALDNFWSERDQLLNVGHRLTSVWDWKRKRPPGRICNRRAAVLI